MKTACLFSLATGFLLIASAHAVPVSLQLSGVITQEIPGTTPDPLDNAYAVGNNFKLFLNYESSVHSDRNLTPQIGLYGDQVSGPFLDFIEWSTDLNEVPFIRSTLITTTIRILNSATDEFEMRGDLLNGGFVTLLLQDLTGQALDSDFLPTSLDLSQWDTGIFTQTQPWGTIINGRLDNLRAVPDSGSALSLLGISFLALGSIRWVSAPRSLRNL